MATIPNLVVDDLAMKITAHVYNKHKAVERKKYTNTHQELSNKYGLEVKADQIKRSKEAIELLISTDGFDVGYESETMVHEVAARFTKAAPALHSLGSALTSPPRTTAMQAESSGIANNVMARNIGLIVGNLSDIAGSLRTITELLGANPTRIKSALRTLQDGELVDSDDEDGERDSDDEPPATQRARKKRARPSAVAAAAAAADSDEGEVEMFDSQASTQPNPPSDLAAALARKSPPAGAAAAASAAPPPVRKAAAKSAKK